MPIIFIKPTPLSVLERFAAAWSDRIVVLDSARRSARKSCFRCPEELAQCLPKLLRYREALMCGGDTEARKVFGRREYAAHESFTTRNNKIARNSRIFYYNGAPIFMDRHIKIGSSDSKAETLRIHFAWCPVSRRIIIGHCGVHLPLG